MTVRVQGEEERGMGSTTRVCVQSLSGEGEGLVVSLLLVIFFYRRRRRGETIMRAVAECEWWRARRAFEAIAKWRAGGEMRGGKNNERKGV